MKTKWFRRSRQILLKYGPGLLIAGFIFWGFVILFEQNNWIAISALATLVLALGAFLTIRQTRNMQKSEKRESLLNEIIEWAIDVAKCSAEKTFPYISDETQFNNIELSVRTRIIDWRLSFEAMGARSQYIRKIARTFGADLSTAVDKLIKQMQAFIEILYECEFNTMKGHWVSRASSEVDKVEIRKQALSTLANNIIEKVADIKTKDVD